MREVVSRDRRAQLLDDIVKDEVTAGARVDHRDIVGAVLARGSDRVLVTVDETGTVHVDRLVGPRRRPLAYVALTAIFIVAALVIVALASQGGMLPR
jgi:hypothetical protein